MIAWFRRVVLRERPKQQAERAAVAYHPDGVPVGLKPGDPIPPQNGAAIFDYVQRHGRRIADELRPGDSAPM